MKTTIQMHMSKCDLTTLIAVNQRCHAVSIVDCNFNINPMTQQQLSQNTPQYFCRFLPDFKLLLKVATNSIFSINATLQ